MSGLRTFSDSCGTEWTVWEVVPRRLSIDAPDRRSGPRRVHATVHDGTERRRRHRRLGLAAGLDGGWLVFRSKGERRRLAPVPPDWDYVDEAALEMYCHSAVTAGR